LFDWKFKNCNVGFNFAFIDEADLLNSTIAFVAKQINYFLSRAAQQQQQLHQSKSHAKLESNISTFKPNMSVTCINEIVLNSNGESSEEGSSHSGSEKAPKKVIDKTDISSPIEFVHINHISMSREDCNKFKVTEPVQFLNKMLLLF
jgi:hypothetical protein